MWPPCSAEFAAASAVVRSLATSSEPRPFDAGSNFMSPFNVGDIRTSYVFDLTLGILWLKASQALAISSHFRGLDLEPPYRAA